MIWRFQILIKYQMGFKMVHSNSKRAKSRVCQSQVCNFHTAHSSALTQNKFGLFNFRCCHFGFCFCGEGELGSLLLPPKKQKSTNMTFVPLYWTRACFPIWNSSRKNWKIKTGLNKFEQHLGLETTLKKLVFQACQQLEQILSYVVVLA